MPSLQELLGILVAAFVIWVLLKMVRVAIRLVVFFASVVFVIGVFYFMFVR